ncbi:hypothetical protein [Paeniglutamicibacter sp.]|uniref:hypothetical protein n=1 Tax=Paeniglutamicibacter sp. TaxID=1934391 RepID=UPI00398A3737
MDPNRIPANIHITDGPLPTIEVNGVVLTIDIVKQIDTITTEALADLQALNPICRTRTSKHGGATEALALHPATGRLIRIEIDGHHIYLHNGTPTGAEATAWAHQHLILAVLPHPQAEQ